MKRETKIIWFVIIVAFVAIALVIFRYEKLLIEIEINAAGEQRVMGGVPVKTDYTAEEIIALIKSSPEYLGDSITIFENGDMVSSNGKFNGTIEAVKTTGGNMDIVRNDMKMNKLPLQYNVYRLAAIYYRQQYPDEIKQLGSSSPQ